MSTRSPRRTPRASIRRTRAPQPVKSSMTHSAINDARESARRLRAALLSGSVGEVEQAIPALTDAARHLRSLEKRMSLAPEAPLPSRDHKGADAECEDLLALKKELAAAEWLVENGAALQHGWARLLGSA